MNLMKHSFASDNNSGIHPNILKAIEEANEGHCFAYGSDPLTERGKQALKNVFGDDIETFFVFNGTGANVLAVKSLVRSWQSVLCAETSHLNEDECGAAEMAVGCKLIPLPVTNGKISIESIAAHLTWLDDEHRSQPRLVSITQPTEFGTLYTPEEIKAIADFCHQHHLLLHIDGARIANAATALSLSLRACTRDLGVDVLSFGGTKNGMLMGEAVLFFQPNLTSETKYFRKQNMQLFSKMRFVGAQFESYLQHNLWYQNASHANRMAALLFEQIRDIEGIQFPFPVQANAVFAILPLPAIEALQERFPFYVFNESTNLVRWMCSYNTTEADVLDFAAAIRQTMLKF